MHKGRLSSCREKSMSTAQYDDSGRSSDRHTHIQSLPLGRRLLPSGVRGTSCSLPVRSSSRIKLDAIENCASICKEVTNTGYGKLRSLGSNLRDHG
jgi:hypothetical protein